MNLPARRKVAVVLRQTLAGAKAALGRALATILSALVWFILCGAVGMGLVVAGVAVLFGTGWALMAAGAFLIFTAALIGRGMKHGRT